MKLSELLARVGDERLSFQMLSHSVTNVTDGKKGGKITFGTTSENAQELMRHFAFGYKPKVTGIVVWVPTDKYETELFEEENHAVEVENRHNSIKT
jgi:hypothetical protein